MTNGFDSFTANRGNLYRLAISILNHSDDKLIERNYTVIVKLELGQGFEG